MLARPLRSRETLIRTAPAFRESPAIGSMHLKPPLSAFSRLSVALLALLSVGALYGGAALVARPDGSLVHYPGSFLEHTPFGSFLVPGLLLLAVNGFFPLAVIALTLRRHPWAARLTVVSGVLLSCWIAVQIALIRLFYPPLHVPYFALGIVLAALGGIEERRRRALATSGPG